MIDIDIKSYLMKHIFEFFWKVPNKNKKHNWN